MKKIISLILIVSGIFIFSGCTLFGGSSNNPAVPAANPVSAPTTTTTPTQVSPAASSNINIQNYSFNPATLTVKKGTTVTWTNNDSAPHQIKSVTFNSNTLNNGQTFSFTFNDLGNFDYSCAIHPSMTGKIIVE